jgi:molecular chaperone DnaJ
MRPNGYYVILGVSRGESEGNIRRAFRELVRRYHPDRAGPRAIRFFQEIVAAYRVLGDPSRRRVYDEALSRARPWRVVMPARAPEALEAGAVPMPVAELAGTPEIRGFFEALRDRIARRLGRETAGAEEGFEGFDVQVVLSPEQAARGGLALFRVPVYYLCPACGGSGREGPFACARCEGEGLEEQEEVVRLYIPPRVADETLLEVPVRGLGVHHVYLRFHLRIGG